MKENERRPEVSVIIPVHNLERYIDACLASVEAQTFGDFEAVVVDDGSTDGSLRLVRSRAERDARIVVVATPNRGVARARETGLAKARGRYVCFLDGDDRWEPDMLRELVAAIGGYDIVCCDFKRVRASYEAPVRERRTEDLEGFGFLEATLSHTVSVCLWAKLYRRELFDAELRHYPLPLGEDELVNVQIGFRQPRVRFVDYVGYDYIQRAGSANRRSVDVDYCERFAEAVDSELARCPGLSAERIGFLRLVSRVRWYLVCIRKSRNPWTGDSDHARWIHRAAKGRGAALRRYYSRGDLLLLWLDRRRLRPVAVLCATLQRWWNSLQRRMAR